MEDALIIGSGKNTSQPLADFAKKDDVKVPSSVLREESVKIPWIYYWEDVVDGQSVLMTMAFQMFGRVYGMSFPIEDQNFVKIDILRKKLFGLVKESLDVLVHHGTQVLDISGNIDPRLVNDQEALRWKFDPLWDKRVAAFNKLVRIKPITRKQAVKLKLLDK